MTSKGTTKDYTYYTKGCWIEKKQRAYQAWLSYLLSPTCAANASSLSSKRLFAKVRGCVAKVYHKDQQLHTAMLKVEASISNGRMRLLTNGGFLTNPSMKKKAMKCLLGYDAFWLKLGVETVFRMTVSPKQKGSKLVASVEEDELQLKAQLLTFIEEQFFSSGELKKKMKNVKRQAAIKEELAAVVLKRFLLLVFLLDRTLTTAELPDGLPLLFEPSSKIKSSADMIRVFLKGSLFGEGDTVKQLEYMGYSLSYRQGVANEFDYRVTNMAIDFRDGIRCCKLVEVLLGTPLLHRANFNTTSNAVKVFNVKLSLATFSERDKTVRLLGDRSILPQDVVDGQGETTVGYLWNIALLFQIPKLVTVGALAFEILQVKIRARTQIEKGDTTKICFPTGYDMRLALLLTWVQTVVSQYGATAKNYRSSFADGSVLCFLICHYLPSYMEPEDVYLTEMTEDLKAEVSRRSTSGSDSEEDEEEIDSDDEDMDLKQFGVYSGKGWMDRKTFKKHRTGILQNFDAVFSVMRALGGIPQTISALDFEEQGPDETAVMLYVSYMCARLLQVSREERAALTIQRMWKIYKGYADPIELIGYEAEEKKRRRPKKSKESRRSHDSLSTAFEYHRQQYSISRASSSAVPSRASSSTGTVFSGFDSTYFFLEPEDLETVVKLQARVRGVLARRRFIKIKAAVKVLEKNHQLVRDRSSFIRKHQTARNAANVIKAHYLRRVLTEAFQKKKAAVVVIQRQWREVASRRREAAVVIQSQWRRHAAQKRCLEMKESMEAIKAQMKQLKEKKQMERATKAATQIQRWWKKAFVRHQLAKKQEAALTIQSAFRGYQPRKELRRAKTAASVIQSAYRKHVAQKEFVAQSTAAVCIQKWIRMYQHRNRFEETKQGVVKIQAQYRMHLCREEFLAIQQAVPYIQSTYRAHLTRKHYESMKAAAVLIQSEWRAYLGRKEDAKTEAAIVLIQSYVRMHQARELFLTQKTAVVVIQRWYRVQLRKKTIEQHHAASLIQSVWKRYNQQQKYQSMQQSVVIIQRAVRLHQKQKWLEDVESRLSSILVDFVSVMEHTHEVVKASIVIQAYARGYLARRHNGVSPSEIRELAQKKLAVKKVMMGFRGYRMRKREAQKEKSVAVLKKWLPVMKDRCQFLKKRNAAVLIQRSLRERQMRRENAAIAIQRAFRSTKEKRQRQRYDRAASKIQSLWRGHAVRSKAPKEVKRAVHRIRSAQKRAKDNPSKTLGAKCKQAVHAVKNNQNVEQTFLALASLEMGTMYSQRCCEDIISSDALIPLLRLMAKSNRSTEHQAAFKRALTILKNLCKYKGLARKVFRATDCLDTLSERLQYYRDCPGIFSDTVSVFQAMLKIDSHKSELANNAHVINQWNSLWSLLARKVDTERKYINKLEADKASDMSAKRATEKAFLASNQLVELGDLFEEVAVAPESFATYAQQLMHEPVETKTKSSTKKKKHKPVLEPTYEDWRYEATDWRPKNMIAKEKLTQLRTTGLPPESSAVMGAVQKSAYVNPKLQKRMRVLSSDMNAEAMERRVNVRLMSDYRKQPKERTGSVEPTAERKGTAMKPSQKINRSSSVALVAESRIPRVAKKAMK